MTIVNIHKAKTSLSALIEQASNGEEIIIAKAGVPVAKLINIKQSKPRKLGVAKHDIDIPDSFFDPLSKEEVDAWYM